MKETLQVNLSKMLPNHVNQGFQKQFAFVKLSCVCGGGERFWVHSVSTEIFVVSGTSNFPTLIRNIQSCIVIVCVRTSPIGNRRRLHAGYIVLIHSEGTEVSGCGEFKKTESAAIRETVFCISYDHIGPTQIK